MRAPEVSRKDRTIVISKEFDKKSSIVGSREYYELIEIQKNFSDYNIVIRSSKKKSDFSNIDLDFMIDYITAHDDAEKSKMEAFKILRGETEGEDGKFSKVSFFELKEWFLGTFPEIEDRVDEAKKRSARLLNEAKENARIHRKSRKSA